MTDLDGQRTPETERVRRIPIPRLPSYLTQLAHYEIRSRSVSLLMTERDDDSSAASCAASLIAVHGKSGLLTARHVWEAARKRPILGVALNDRILRLETAGLYAFAPARDGLLEGEKAEVPDLAFVYLHPEHRATIQACGRVFYSIDRRRQSTQFDLFGDDGFYVVVGSPIERIDIVNARIASLTYDTEISRQLQQSGWDYIFVNLNIEGNPEIPNDYKGVSGGGLWRVKFLASPDLKNFWIEDPARDIILVGVNFYQTDIPGRQLIAHGPKSIYERLYMELSSAS